MEKKLAEAREALDEICKTCKNHAALTQKVDFNYIHYEKEAAEQSKHINGLEEKLDQTNLAVSKRIPIVHAIALAGSVVAILSLLIGLQISANKDTNERMIELIKEVTATKTLLLSHQQTNVQFNQIMEQIERIEKREP